MSFRHGNQQQHGPQHAQAIKYKETEEFRKDILAAAALSQCKPQTRNFMYQRIMAGLSKGDAADAQKKFEDAEQAWMDCVNDYANVRVDCCATTIKKQCAILQWFLQIFLFIFFYQKKYASWSSAVTQTGQLYYFDRATLASQWKRPADIDNDILKGKRCDDFTEPWHECEFLHVSLLQCERSSMGETGCVQQQNKFNKCMLQRM